MLRSQNRVDRQEGFGTVLKRGGKAADRVLVVSVLLSDAATPPRAGVIVGKREFALATRRNRIKRRLRHLVSFRLGELPEGSAIVVRALAGARGLSSDQLAASLDKLMARALRRAEAKIASVTSPAAELAR